MVFGGIEKLLCFGLKPHPYPVSQSQASGASAVEYIRRVLAIVKIPGQCTSGQQVMLQKKSDKLSIYSVVVAKPV